MTGKSSIQELYVAMMDYFQATNAIPMIITSRTNEHIPCTFYENPVHDEDEVIRVPYNNNPSSYTQRLSVTHHRYIRARIIDEPLNAIVRVAFSSSTDVQDE